MAIKLLGHVWRSAATAAPVGPRPGSHDWVVERREPSRWNPTTAGASMPSTLAETRTSEPPPWAETQPWWHG